MHDLGIIIPVTAVAMSPLAWVATTWIRAKHGYPLEDEKGNPVTRSDPDAKRTIELLTNAVARYTDIIGLYSAGGDNAAIATVLRRYRQRPVFWVGHELSDATRGYLKEGLMTIVLDQAPEVQARRAIDLTLKRLGLIDTDVDLEPVRFLTVTPESL